MNTLPNPRALRILLAVCCLLIATDALGSANAPVRVMVLGTYHMGNPGEDLHNVVAADVLTPRRQAELESVAAALTEFRPTVIALERVTLPPHFIDERFHGFDGAQLATVRDERIQVGYRLARKLGLQEVHGIDEQPSAGEPDYFPLDKVQSFASARGESAALQAMVDRIGTMLAEFEQRQPDSTIAELLAEANDPRTLADAAFYYQLLSLDQGEQQPAAELLGYWYMRNAKIVAKLLDVAKPGDRVLVIFGVGQKHWLEQLVRGTPGLELVDPVPYLLGSR